MERIVHLRRQPRSAVRLKRQGCSVPTTVVMIPAGSHFANALVFAVADVQVSRAVESDAVQEVQVWAEVASAPVTGETCCAGPCDRRDDPVGRRPLLHPVVELVGDVEGALGVDRDPIRPVELGGCRLTAVA